MNSNHKGFTLIELMMVIAIIGVIASIALPQYANYIGRAKFSEIIMHTAERKSAVNLCAQETNTLKNCSGDNAADSYAGIPDDITSGLGNYVKSIKTKDGVISVETTDQLGSVDYVLRPSKSGNAVTWVSEGSCEAAGLCRH